MNFIARDHRGIVNLQATLSTSSAVPGTDPGLPHHPITCSGKLELDEDGTFSCEHASVPPGDERTRMCIDHTIALMLIELSQQL